MYNGSMAAVISDYSLDSGSSDRIFPQPPLSSDMSAAAPPGSASGSYISHYQGTQNAPGPPLLYGKRSREESERNNESVNRTPPGHLSVESWQPELKRIKLAPDLYNSNPELSDHSTYSQTQMYNDLSRNQQLEQLQERYRSSSPGTTSSTNHSPPNYYSAPRGVNDWNGASSQGSAPTSAPTSDSLPPFGCGLPSTQSRMYSLPSPVKTTGSTTPSSAALFGCASSLFPKPMSNEHDPLSTLPLRREPTSMVDLKNQQQYALQNLQQQHLQQQHQHQQQLQQQQNMYYHPQSSHTGTSNLRYSPESAQVSTSPRPVHNTQSITPLSAPPLSTSNLQYPHFQPPVPQMTPGSGPSSIAMKNAMDASMRIGKKPKERKTASAGGTPQGEKIEITHLLNLPQSQAAQILNMSQATFSKRFREANDKRWPYRRLIVLEKQMRTAMSEGDKSTVQTLEAAKIQLLGPCYIYKRNEDKKKPEDEV